jgi:hypothetical protein
MRVVPQGTGAGFAIVADFRDYGCDALVRRIVNIITGLRETFRITQPLLALRIK